MTAPTTAEVRDEIADTRRHGRGAAQAGHVLALETWALPLAEHRDALAAEVARLREALEKRYAAGHNDTCAAMLGDYACSCGHDGLLEATAKGAGR